MLVRGAEPMENRQRREPFPVALLLSPARISYILYFVLLLLAAAERPSGASQ